MDLFNGRKYVPGELIRLLRSIKGIKQATAAKKADVCQQAISKLECCKKVSVVKFLSLAKAFNCTEAEIKKVIDFLPPPQRLNNIIFTQCFMRAYLLE
jgi:transcriptional regulator with XRE-family HTH domain